MHDTEEGAFGETLRKTFRVDDAPVFVARTLRKARIAVTEINCNIVNNGLSEPIPRQDAFLMVTQLRECPHHSMFLDGRQIATGHLLPGTTCIYDLRTNPQADSVSPFHHVSFYLPRAALDVIAENEGLPRIEDFNHDPGFGVIDPVIHGLAACLLPSFENSDDASPLFVDHLTIAAAAHAVSTYGNAARPGDARQGCLASWQEARVREIMTANLSGDLTLDDLAAACGLPQLYFARAFHQSFGMAPHRWLMQARVEQARRLLLRRPVLPLADIAHACGFASPQHLARVFRRAIGAHPDYWRHLN